MVPNLYTEDFREFPIGSKDLGRGFHVLYQAYTVRKTIPKALGFFPTSKLVAVGKLCHPQLSKGWHACFSFNSVSNHLTNVTFPHSSLPPPSHPSLPPAKLLEYERPRIYKSNGYLKVTCNGGLNQMRAAICDMVTIARYLNLTLLVPELDKHSFWGDPSSFDDIFDAKHFINSLRDEVRIIEGLPSKLTDSSDGNVLAMHPVSWSNEMYYKQQILPLFRKYKMIHFNRTDARLANNALPTELQKLRCRVNFQALKFNQQIEQLGRKLVNILKKKGRFVALHLRYEMDMLAFTGCTHGCSENEAEELKRMRYAYPRWREKEIVSEQKRLEGLCPLTPEETALVLRALGFKKETQVYIASGETYGSELRLAVLRSAFPRIVRKEMLLEPEDLKHFRNHSSQMAALDYIVSLASDIFIPTFNGNMAKLVEGHRRYLGFRKTIVLDRKKLVQLLDMHQTGTLSWNQFAFHVQEAHKQRSGQPVCRRVIPDKPKEEHYFYANPQECFCSTSNRVFFDNTCKACI